MGLFGNNKKRELPSLMLEDEPSDFDSALAFLRGLSNQDYRTICDVAQTYREADAKAEALLGSDNAPTTFIHPPEPKETGNFLDDDDIAFIDDEPTKKAKTKSTKVTVKDEKDN